jgi:hypothetical protein
MSAGSYLDRYLVAPIINGEAPTGKQLNITGTGFTVIEHPDLDETELAFAPTGALPLDDASFGVNARAKSRIIEVQTKDSPGQNVVSTVFSVPPDTVADLVVTALGVNTAGDVFLADIRRQVKRHDTGAAAYIAADEKTVKVSHGTCDVSFDLSSNDATIHTIGTATEVMQWTLTVQIQIVSEAS